MWSSALGNMGAAIDFNHEKGVRREYSVLVKHMYHQFNKLHIFVFRVQHPCN